MTETNSNSRLEAFCDAVFAIALTLLVIDIKVPSSEGISTTADFWHALLHLGPTLFAFVLSFAVILITWVNHHNTLKLVSKSASSFIYANGFLLLTVVFIPFPTSLLGEYLLTDQSAPAVILYDSVLVLQALGWILMTGVALKNRLAKNDLATLKIRQANKYGYFGFALYSVCAIVAFWFPLAIAIVTTIIWIFWLIFGITIKQEE